MLLLWSDPRPAVRCGALRRTCTTSPQLVEQSRNPIRPRSTDGDKLPCRRRRTSLHAPIARRTRLVIVAVTKKLAAVHTPSSPASKSGHCGSVALSAGCSTDGRCGHGTCRVKCMRWAGCMHQTYTDVLRCEKEYHLLCQIHPTAWCMHHSHADVPFRGKHHHLRNMQLLAATHPVVAGREAPDAALFHLEAPQDPARAAGLQVRLRLSVPEGAHLRAKRPHP